MKLSRLLEIIKEEVQDYFSDWSMNDEPSLADKYYEKNLGIMAQPPAQHIDGEYFGTLRTIWGKPIEKPINVYKNPKTLTGFGSTTRGVLVSNGDLYVAETTDGMHSDILELLADKGVIPHESVTSDYDSRLPKEYITIIRTATTNQFAQSPGYEAFPDYYVRMFDLANRKHPTIKFRNISPKQQVWLANPD
jgi:hypothetical protein